MAEFKCEICSKNFGTNESLEQHKSMKHSSEDEKPRKRSFRKYIILGIIGLIIVFFSFSIYSYTKKPGQYDNFAKCLTEKGAIVYGNDFCSYTNKQLNYFGKSNKYLNYVKCAENQELCNSNGIKITPTWEIKGKMYEQVQSFETLSIASGCEI